MDNEFPLALYRDGAAFVWDGRSVDMLTVADADELDAAREDGWRTAAEYLEGPDAGAEPSLLDRSAKDIAAELPDLTIEELEDLKANETAGKTRKGVLAAIDAAIDAKLAA